MTPLASSSLKMAQSQNGVQELPRGSNAGVAVEKYLKSVGLGKGFSWCMAFVYWCVAEACKKQEAANPLVRTAGVLNQWNKINKSYKKTTPKPGDIFIMDYGKGLGHTGFVVSIGKNGQLTTIEGNTNDEGSREGYEVCIRTRNIKQIKGYIRI